MQNKKTTATANLHLPEEIIERIQSFLGVKEAARTSVLSKSWGSAWSTRPNLDLDQRYFPSGRDDFAKFAIKTLQTYQDSKKSIQSLRLWMDYGWKHDMKYCWMPSDISLPKELIVKAMRVGVIDLKIQLWTADPHFVLPDVVLGSKTLECLSVIGCTINLGSSKEVSCSKLKSLYLSSVIVNGDLFTDFLLKCPLIESLVWNEKPCIFDDQRKYSLYFDDFHKYTHSLWGCWRTTNAVFPPDLCSKFHQLKELVVWDCCCSNDMQISSPSLERISLRFSPSKRVIAKFDVPCVQIFQFEGCASSCLTFEATYRVWKSDLHVTFSSPSASWFDDLNAIVKKLSATSKVSVSVHAMFHENFRINPMYLDDDDGLVPVEKLMVFAYASPRAVTRTFLEDLSRSCRPKLLVLHWSPVDGGYCYIGPKFRSSIIRVHDTEVEAFEETQTKWLFLPWKTVFAQSKPRFLRFQLRWESDETA